MREFLIIFVIVFVVIIGGLAVCFLMSARSFQAEDAQESQTLMAYTPESSLPISGDANQKPAKNLVFKFPVFNYHHIRPMPPETAHINERSFTVTPEGFEKHLQYFRDNGYQPVTLNALFDFFETGQPLPKKAVAITFDDGRWGQYDLAFPLLQKYGFAATFFIVTDWVGQDGFVTWDEVREMSDAGMLIGSHTLDHFNMNTLSDERLAQECANSKTIIEGKIGKKVDYLAYPGGSHNQRVMDAVKAAGYKGAMTVFKIIDQSPAWPYEIRRFHADDDLGSIMSKLAEY